MSKPHIVDMQPARAAGKSLFAANDPKAAEFELLQAPPRVDPKCDLADQLALERQLPFAHVAEVQGRPS